MPASRFELPQLSLTSGSLTDGTDIPPPPDSPIEEKPPPAALKRGLPDDPAISATNGAVNGSANGNVNGNGVHRHGGSKASTDTRPPIPSTIRPSSIRRFLSRKSLNTNYESGANSNSNEDLASIGRPESAMSYASGRHVDKKSRLSWFRRFSSDVGSRTSVIYEEKRASIMPMGPPPPKLPELSKLRAKIPEDDEGSLGGEELFKNIK